MIEINILGFSFHVAKYFVLYLPLSFIKRSIIVGKSNISLQWS